jgi:RNA polymerase sigma factor (sigma-70 family)
MATGQLGPILRHIRTLVAAQADEDLTDAQLLARFTLRQDQGAFAVLMKRHGPLVWNVCRHALGSEPDAEDAFQATFLVLALKAASIRKTASVASWLHGAAYRSALQIRRQGARRRFHEQQVVCMRQPPRQSDSALRELQAVLDEEIQRLRQEYRAPFVLCCLEGKSKAEAARELGWKEGTVSGRLARARKQLQERLIRRGIRISAVLCATAISDTASRATTLAPLAAATAQAALWITAGKAVTACGVSARVAVVAQGTAKAMSAANSKFAVILLLALGLSGIGSAALTLQPLIAKPGDTSLAESAEATIEQVRQPKPVAENQARTDGYGDALPPGAIARLGTLRLRQGGNVHHLALSPDGKTLVSGGQGGTIRFWELASGRELRHIQAHRAQVLAVAFSPDGKSLTSGSSDARGAWLWDVATGNPVRQFLGSPPRKDWVRAVAFSPDGKTLATAGPNTIRLWEPATGKELRALEGHGSTVGCIGFSPNGRYLVSGSADHTVRLWDTASGQEIRAFRGHEAEVLAVAVSPDGKLAASGALDHSVRLWDLATGKEIHRLKGTIGYGCYPCGGPAIAFSPDGKTLATGGHTISLWDVASGKELYRLTTPDGLVNSLVFSTDGKRLVSASHSDNTIRIWDLVNRTEIAPFGGPPPAEIEYLFISADDKTLVSRGSDQMLRVWDLAAKELQAFATPNAWPMALSQDGKSLVMTEAEAPVVPESILAPRLMVLRDLATGRKLWTVSGPQGEVRCATLSGDGKLLFSGGRDRTIHVWDVQTGKQLRWFPAHPDAADRKSVGEGIGYAPGVCTLVPSPDGKALASSSVGGKNDPRLWLWDPATGKELRPLQQEPVHRLSLRVAFSPDGKILAAEGTSEAILLWDVTTGRKLRPFKAPDPDAVNRSLTFAFSHDGKALAWAGEDAVVHVWEVATRQERCQFAGHRGAVFSVAFSSDDNLLVSTSADLTGLIWDLGGRSGPQRGFLDATELADSWAALASANAGRAYRAVQRLAAAPEQSIAFLRQHLKPVEAVDSETHKKIDRLITELDSTRFAVREKATQELTLAEELAEPALSQALAGRPSLETHRRIEGLLQRLEGPVTGPERLRALRSIEVLEKIGSLESQQLLTLLGGGAPEARLTQEAKAARSRTASRDKTEAGQSTPRQ